MPDIQFSIEELRELKKKVESPDPWEALTAIEQVLTTMFNSQNETRGQKGSRAKTKQTTTSRPKRSKKSTR